MKKIIFIIITFIGLGLLFSCEKEAQDPKLDMSKTVKPVVTNPTTGGAFVLLKEDADSVLTTIEWTEAVYNLTNIETVKYLLEVDLAANNFANPFTLATGTATSYVVKVGNMNALLIGTWELDFGVPYEVAFRVRSFINTMDDYSYAYSETLTVTVTPYDDAVAVKPIFLIGGATTIGWDNTLALPMAHLDGARYAIVEQLKGSDYIKFISVLGAWAPQWGTDATGTAEAGPLVYRPTESVPDPPAIPASTVAGAYYIEADTVNLTYKTFLTSGQLFLVGDATLAGWDAALAIPFTESSAHVFTLTTTLHAGGGMKFLEVQGAWAPQWGTDADGKPNKGMLSYRPTEAVPDPPSIAGPAEEGQYTITVNTVTMQYSVAAAK
jgi:starch-binding outer membrane protein SusE/F